MLEFKPYLTHRFSKFPKTAITSFFLVSAPLISVAAECPMEPQKITGTIYCDNKFTLWVNGEKIAEDPIDFTPHQAVDVEFHWDGTSNITYAIQCEDYASPSGFEYTETKRPQLGDGALIAKFKDGLGTTSSKEWKVFTSTYGPTEASEAAGCSAKNLDKCVVEDRGIPTNWSQPAFDDSTWSNATLYTAEEAGWGRTPSWSETHGCCTLSSPLNRESLGCLTSIDKKACLSPREVFNDDTAEFIWAADLEKDNRVLFRYTATCNSK